MARKRGVARSPTPARDQRLRTAPIPRRPVTQDERTTLPTRLDVPDAQRAKYAYAVETLLFGLGLAPDWHAAAPVLVVGAVAEGAPVAYAASPEALRTFAHRLPVGPEQVAWLETPAGRVPLVFGTPEAPDLFASAFYWLSGWAEGTTRQVDAHGRFPYEASLQHALDTAHVPVVEVYAAHLAARLRAAGVAVPGRSWGGRAWALCPTHDLDALRTWTPKSLWRSLRTPRALLDALRHGDPLVRGARHLIETERAGGHGATYFVKGGAGAPEDHAYPLGHPAVRLVGRTPGLEIGLHPSYHAATHAEKLAAELDGLARAVGRPVRAVRHHYLRYTPATAGHHAAIGVALDATLGFAEHEGFRRGTCRPFHVYDLVRDAPTDVWEMPLALMDTTLFGYRGFDDEGARAATRRMLVEVQAHGGVCVALWHNDLPDGSRQRRHFHETLEAAVAGGALVASLSDALAAWRGV